MPIPRPILPRSLRARLACAFALLGTALALLLALAFGSLLARETRGEAGARLHATASNAARLLADGLHARMREVQGLADSATLWSDGLVSPQVAETLERLHALDPHNAWVGVTDAAGVVRSASRRMLVGADVAQRPWFAAGRRGVFVGDVHPAVLLARMLPPASDGGPQRFVDFAAPIRGEDGRLLGVLGLHGSWDWTRDTIESLLPPPERRLGVEVFVFDRGGRMIYAPHGTLAQHQQAGETLAPLADGVPDGVRPWRDGKDYLTAAVPMTALSALSDLGWTVVARQPADVAHAAMRDGIWLVLLVAASAAAAAAGFGWWAAARLTRQLSRIAQDAQALQAAAVPVELPQHRGSHEIEQLSGALAGMTRRLLQANAELERRVQQRTADLERANAALERLAHHDPLTGLLNRRGYDERLVAALAAARRQGTPLSLLVIDADHFKQVNDRHGHDVGDQVLRAIGAALRSRLRVTDFVARIGGEEFVAVLPDTAWAGAEHLAAELVATLRATPMPAVGRVTVSCGGAELCAATETPEAALRRADAALYQAKQTGRDRYCMAAPLRPASAGTATEPAAAAEAAEATA